MVQDGNAAIIHYTARLYDIDEPSCVVDTTDPVVAKEHEIYNPHRDYGPLEFKVGSNNVAPVINNTVKQLSSGEQTTVVADPKEAYGTYTDNYVKEIDKQAFASISNDRPEQGQLIQTADGQTGWVTAVDETTVTIDFNHELAGEDIELTVRVLDAYGIG